MDDYFYSKVNKTDNCWLWKGLIGKTGSAIFIRNQKEYSARIFVLQLQNRDPGKNKIFATCNDKLCVNPDHLDFGDAARFYSKIQKLDELNGCWIWVGSEDKNGYGKFCYSDSAGKQIDVRAHRYSWELRWGPISSSIIFVCHKCDNPRCVNPDHLFLGSAEDNAHDRDIKGRHRTNAPKGSQSPLSKITEAQAIEIKQSKLAVKNLVKIYNISDTLIYDIRNGKRWISATDHL